MKISADEARMLWKALMDNAASLVRDGELLLGAGSFGRAASMTVLAQEELGKALWIYGTFEGSWSQGETEALVVTEIKEHGRDHAKKYMEAIVFGRELAEFWDDYSTDYSYGDDAESWERLWREQRERAEAAAKAANLLKQRGFYVDRGPGGSVLSPVDIGRGSLAQDLQTAAQVIEMLLIKDHTRMKHFSKEPYDGTHGTQFGLLPIAHPEDWAAATEYARHKSDVSTGTTEGSVEEPLDGTAI